MNAVPSWLDAVAWVAAVLAALSLTMCTPKGEGSGAPVGDEAPVAAVPAEKPAVDAPPAEVADGEAAQAAVGTVVRVRGTARNAKLAAAVVSDGLLVYCLDRDGWPAELNGKPVVAEGTLEHTDEFAAKTAPDGAISAGTDGPVFVIRSCGVTPAG